MKRKNEQTRNHLFFEVYVNYALLMVLFTVVLGCIYLRFYQTASEADYKKQLEEQAVNISSSLTNFIVNEDYENYLTRIEVLRELGMDDIWTISNPNAKWPMDSRMESVDLSDTSVSEESKQLIQKAFLGERDYKTYYSEIHGSTVITLGIPIYGINGEVCGALLLNKGMETKDKVVSNSLNMIINSMIVAAVVSFILAILFARQLTKPIIKMRHMALKLARGEYEIKTGINRKDEIGDLAKTLDFLTDKLQENEKIRKELDQMRLDFFANVSHELRTPITVVRAYTESLVDGVITGEEKTKQYYQRMLLECKSMERLVGDLLLLSKMQNPDFVIEMEPVNLIQIFEELTRNVRAISKEKEIKIKFSHDQEVYMIYGDYDRLRQMFLVILDNAIKFSPDYSTIYIKVSKKDKIEVSIKDEGIGISEEELPSIFEKFYKSKLRQNAKGSGLGLAIAKQIALRHGGTIEVKSKLNVGTEFIFSFHEMSNINTFEEKITEDEK